MSNSPLQIIRQADWDLWVLVCVLASLILISYAVFGRLWETNRGRIALGLVAAGVLGTAAILLTPQLQDSQYGMYWTFVVLSLLSATFYIRLLPQLRGRRMGILLGMRIAALAMMVLMFFEPQLHYTTLPRPERPMIFLIDASGSMSFPDVQNGPTRVQSVWQALRPQLRRINDHFVPSFHTFATDLTDLKDPQDLSRLTPDGKATDIAKACRRARYKSNHPGAVLILVSDGRDNVSSDPVGPIRQINWPVHTIRVGSEQAEPATLANVAIDNIEAPDDFVVGHEARIKVIVKSSALANRVVEVRLAPVDANGKPTSDVKTSTLVLEPTPEGQAVEMPYTPRSIGVHRLAAWIDPIAGERSTADNRQEFQGLAMDPRVKVLYLEGRVRPEYRELVRALSRDPNIEVASLLRVQQQRFAASGTVDGQTFEQIPQTLDQWKKFDVLILGDLDASFIKPHQNDIARLVEGGGGLVMFGGESSFGPGGYQGTPIETALPVYVGDTKSPQETTQFVPRLTAEGAAHPAMEGLAEWFGVDQQKPRKELPSLRGNVVVARAKAGAQVLAVHPERLGPDGKPQIVLATHRYGQGRAAAFTADTTYLWYLPLRGMGQDSPYNRFWGQIVRWLAGEDVRNRQRGPGVEALLNKSVYQLGESVHVRAMVRDERGDATEYAAVTLALKQSGQPDKQLSLNRVESRRGLYEVRLGGEDLPKGDYTVELSASTQAGKALGKQGLKFTVLPPADEMLKIAANPRLLTDIATRTGGQTYELRDLPNLIDYLIRTDKYAPTARQEVIPLANTPRSLLALLGRNPDWPMKWNLPMQAALVVSLLALEWVLRRRWQLP